MSTTRRKFVLAGGLGAAAAFGWPKVHETFAIGSLVANYRTDSITGKDGNRHQALRVGGVFYLRDGKITEWIDSVVNS